MLLWSGQTVSEMGSAVTQLALPLTAVVVLGASTFQVGLLTSAATAAFALIALPAGALVDRRAKRRLMIWCDAARMLIIGSVPLAAAFGLLTMGQLYAVAFTAGVCTVFFDVAYQSFLPAVVTREHKVDGNGKLGASQAFAQVAGPGLVGGLVGAAGAMAADAISYAVSVASLLAIRVLEEARAPTSAGRACAPRSPKGARSCCGTCARSRPAPAPRTCSAAWPSHSRSCSWSACCGSVPPTPGCSSPWPASAGWPAGCWPAG
jgi:MFS family permease